MRRYPLAIAVLAAVCGLVLAACSADRNGGAEEKAGGDAAAQVGPAAVQSDDGAGEDRGASGISAEEAAEMEQAQSVSLPALGPRVVQTATVRIRVGRGEFEEAVDEARTVAAGLGGFVVSSTASQEGQDRLVRGSLAVRVPSRQYARAMSSLARIGRVEAREESSSDVSQEFVDLEARARHLEAVERQLLSLLTRARTVPAALSVQSQLNETQLQLEQVRGRLRFLEDQTSYATITLSLREQPVAAEPRDGGWGVVDMWRAGARAFLGVAGRMFVVLAGAAPLALLAGLVLLGVRLVRRRPLFRWGASRP